MGFGPIVVDWACSLQKKQETVPEAYTRALYGADTSFCNLPLDKTHCMNTLIECFRIVGVPCMQPITRFHNLSRAAMKWRQTTQNICFGPKVVDWASLLPENKKRSWRHKLVH